MARISHRLKATFYSLALAILLTSVLDTSPQSHAAPAARPEAVIRGFPSVMQWYNLSCEYAAAAAVTLYWGNLVSQRDFIREIPVHPNPHIGFRGNIHGPHGGIGDYGIYAEPLVPVLERRGYEAAVFYGGVSRLKANIAAGYPVVVWITTGRDAQRRAVRTMFKGQSFKLVPYEHTVVAYGYDEDGIYLMDVGDGGFYYTGWNSFLRRWSYFDQMALVIYPE
jgi:uncharacterized protein YvpB